MMGKIITVVGLLAIGAAQAEQLALGHPPAAVSQPKARAMPVATRNMPTAAWAPIPGVAAMFPTVDIAAARARFGMEGELPAVPYWVQVERLKRELNPPCEHACIEDRRTPPPKEVRTIRIKRGD